MATRSLVAEQAWISTGLIALSGNRLRGTVFELLPRIYCENLSRVAAYNLPGDSLQTDLTVDMHGQAAYFPIVTTALLISESAGNWGA